MFCIMYMCVNRLQNPIREFDFLPNADRQHIPSTIQQRSHEPLSPDVYHRPLLSMPPVILMGGFGDGRGNGNDNDDDDYGSRYGTTLYSGPIIEMPPSPAPSMQEMIIEFPEDEIVEVRIV